ncbi:MAG: PTS transporter subunit EIIB, partial [Clostridia bacterium]|nr:PTS transporter subunit EIIB [Clostridia bacterium]
MGLRNEYVSTMIYEELANGIIECVGGTENIDSAINCMKRVCIRVNRDAAVRDDDLRALDGVLSVTH